VVDRVALEMRSTRKGTGGSNPSLSASCQLCLLQFLSCVLACVLLSSAARAEDAQSQIDSVDEFVGAYRCMIVEQLLAIHEHGNPSKSDNRYFIVAMTHSPQRFVQCIFHDIDTIIFCEASSGRYGPRAGQPKTFETTPETDAALKRLGFSEPSGVANYEQEFPLGDPPDLESIAKLLLTTLYDVYGARDGTAMDLTTPLVTKGNTKLDRCKPLS
jgi:hypothetical protein